MKRAGKITSDEKARIKAWVEAWRRAGPELERLRRREIRRANTASAIAALSGPFESAMRQFPPRATSGLVEQQRRFRRAER